MEIIEQLLPFGKGVVITALILMSIFLVFFMTMFYKVTKNIFKNFDK